MRLTISENEEELIDRLIKTGFNKNVVKVLVYTAYHDESTTRELEQNLNLRQPEVSVAVQILKDKNWITKRDVKTGGRGAPVQVYSLNKSFKEIISKILEEERQKIQERKNNINRIEELVQKYFG